MQNVTLTRRGFLRLTGGTAGVALLAACAPPAPSGDAAMDDAPSTEPVVIRYAGLENMGATTEDFLKPWLEEQGYGWERGSFGQQELTDKIMQSVATNTYLADVFQFPSNARADVVAAKAIYPIPEFVKDAIDFDDILPSMVNTLTWDGTVYSLPYDGDVHYYAFRKDLMADSAMSSDFESEMGFALDPETGAKTWDEWRAIGEYFTGKDWNGNGEEDDYGLVCMTKRGDTLWWGFHSRATAYGKHPDDPSYFIDIDTGEARVNNPGFVRALTEWVEENKNWAPPGGLGFTYGDSLNAMNGGRAVQTYNWDAVSTAAAGEFSVIQGLQGYDILPGSHEVYNHKEGGWDSFEEPSSAPFHAFGGWVLAISALTDDSVIEHVWKMAIQLSKPESGLWYVTNLTGASPYRYSQLEAVDEFANGPLQLGEEVARDYLDAAKRTLDHPNAVTDQAFGGWVQYRDALELGVSKAMADEADPQTAMDEVATAFDEISDRMGGKERQAELYRITLGL
jgi:multiple sugar transport system substrate-binding protein